jgi:hypothetical protein
MEDNTQEATPEVAQEETKIDDNTPATPTPDVPAEEKLNDEEKVELSEMDKWQAENKKTVIAWVEELMKSEIPCQYAVQLPDVLRSLLNTTIASAEIYNALVVAKQAVDNTPLNKLYEGKNVSLKTTGDVEAV